ncbi:hypothetical protein V496_07503 [Pseudogymnoascus sp. VKM F-4515 (FW-2607)]|nr:hypothetical protein V496_07503 [Pseudogymnoascus sp. VKM F-4515 (FW-2607)]
MRAGVLQAVPRYAEPLALAPPDAAARALASSALPPPRRGRRHRVPPHRSAAARLKQLRVCRRPARPRPRRRVSLRVRVLLRRRARLAGRRRAPPPRARERIPEHRAADQHRDRAAQAAGGLHHVRDEPRVARARVLGLHGAVHA